MCFCLGNPEVFPLEGKCFAVATQRTHTWSGIEQIVTDRIDLETVYDVVAVVRISGSCSKAVVKATLYLQEDDRSERYITMGRLVVLQNIVVRVGSSTTKDHAFPVRCQSPENEILFAKEAFRYLLNVKALTLLA